MIQELGLDSVGIISKVKSKLNSEIYFLNKVMDEKDKLDVKREFIFLKKLNHPNICKYLGNFEQNGNDYFILKFIGEKNVFNIRKTNLQ